MSDKKVKFVMVEEPDSPKAKAGDAKSAAAIPLSAPLSLKLAKMAMSRRWPNGGQRKGKEGVHFPTRIFVKVTAGSTAGTALALVQGVIPSASAEWASFQALFDDYKVLGVKVHYLITSSVASVAAATPCYAWCFDATYNSAPTSVVSVLESDRHQLGALDPSANYPVTSHPSGGLNGMRVFAVKIPSNPTLSPSAVTGGTGLVDNFPGSWIDMGDATNASSGFLKLYFEATTTSVITVTAFLEYDLIFRQRT